MEWVRSKLGFEGLFVVEPQGRGGGLALMWKDADQASLIGFSQNHIDIEVRIEGMRPWRLTGLYGEPVRAKRKKTWNLLRNLARDSNLPWCVIGDLNNVTSQEDKHGGAQYPGWLIEGFNSMLTETGLHDMDLVGHQFTWERGRGTEEWMEVRLDRALMSALWLEAFPVAKLYNLEGSTSDHSPLLLIPQQVINNNKHQRFRFENAWLTEPMCAQLMRDSWEGNTSLGIQQKVKVCGEKLMIWGRELTGNFASRIKGCKKELKRLRNKRDMQSQESYNAERKKLTLILSQREIFWRQRSKQLWLHSGDQNNRFFHAAASTRRRNNQIHRLQNDAGQWVEWDNGLAELMSDYFTALFTETQASWEEVIQYIPTTISVVQNEELMKPITDEEVKDALFQMHPDKSPGPDGMTPAFFQKQWKIVGKDVIIMVKNFFTDGVIPTDLNNTNVVLIPKKKCPTKMTELRPISLCNVLIKIITKIITNRMKGMLESVVSENQSAFIPGRLISDNVMISYEVMHYLKRKRRGKEGCMALKIDMSKAYDRLEWDYLRAILTKMGFNEWWVYLIMQCVCSVSYQIIHGTHEIGPILPSRGIRQGDPLSPYLFIICAEGLSALIRNYEARKWIHGVKVCRSAPSITHMLFADDSYLYCHAKEEEVRRIMDLLHIFEAASGQEVNLLKSSVFFSTNVSSSDRTELCQMLQMTEAIAGSTYLGLPNMLSRNKTATLGFLKDKVRQRIKNWDGRWISQAGREILVKTVAQTLPTYAMSVFLIPVEIIKDLERMISKFWWGAKSDNNRRIHWMSWSKICRHKSAGGLGFRDFRDFNLALLAKQGWRMLTSPNSLVTQVYRARYFPHSNFLEASIGNNPSFIWRSIWEAKSVIAAGARWKIGLGNKINIAGQPWLLDELNPYITSEAPAL